MKDSVLLHRKAKPSAKHAHENIPDAWAKWNETAEQARQIGHGDLVEKYLPDRGAGWYTIYMAERKLREGLEHESSKN